MKHSRGNTGTFRRVVKQASICLLLGAIVNVAVAWGCVCWSPEWFPQFDGMKEYRDAIVHVEADDWAVSPPSYWQKNSLLRREELTFGMAKVFTNGPHIGKKSGSTYQTVLKAGLPLYSLYSSRHVERPPLVFMFTSLIDEPKSLKDGISMSFVPKWFLPNVYDRCLPTRPIWPGFLINILFYGVIWFGLFFGFGATRSKIRRKRGRCPKCGYDLRGTSGGDFESGCPECGWNRNEDCK